MQYHPLPVPADNLISGNWISEPYKVPLPVPAKPIFQQRPDLQWVLSLTAAVLVNNLQDNCRNSAVSIFAYNLFSSNAFNNQFFLTICDEASDFALQQLQYAQQGSDPSATVTNAVRFYANYATAKCAVNFPALQQYLTPDMGAKIHQVIQQWNQVSGGMAQQQPVQQPAYGGQMPMGAAPGYGQYTAGANVSVNVNQGGMGGLTYNPPTAQQDSKFGSATVEDNRPRPAARARQQPNEELRDLGVVETSNFNQAPAPKVETVRVAPAVSTAPAEDGRMRPARVVRDTSGPVPESVPAGVTIASDIPDVSVFAPEEQAADLEWVGHVEFANEKREEYTIPETVQGHWLFRPKHNAASLPTSYEDAELEDEEDLEILDVIELVENEEDPIGILKLRGDLVAVRVGAKDPGRTWSIDQPHNHPYNPLEHIRYLVTGEGDTCFEAFMPRDENVEYIDLEFDEAKRAQARMEKLSQQNILADTSVITEIKPRGVPYTIIGAVDELDKANNSSDQQKLISEIEKFQGKFTFFETPDKPMEIGAAQYMVERFHERVSAKNAVPATSGYYEREFVVAGIASKVDAFVSTAPQNRLAKLLLLMTDLREKSSRAFLYLNEICTKEVNRALDHALGLEEYVITDFSGDYFDLCNMIEETKSEAVFQRLNEAVGKAVGYLDLSYSGTVLKIRHNYRIMGLPVGMASFDLPVTAGELYRVTASVSPEVYTLVRNLDQVEKAGPLGKTLLFGTDGQLLEVVSSVWDEGYFTLLPVHGN